MQSDFVRTQGVCGNSDGFNEYYKRSSLPMDTHIAFERLKTRVLSFAGSDKSGAMLVHGPWGIGKTYAVLEALKASKHEDQISFSYVSLYGISTLDDIYMRLALGWMNKISQKVPEWLAPSLDAIKDSTIARRTPSVLGSVASIFIGKDKFDAASAATVGLLVNKMVIVFDDIERKDPSLDIRAILGVTSYLVESRECRVIFITNDGAITGEDKQVFEAHKEKIFDFEVPYSPTVEENAAIFATNYKNFLLPTLITLGIKNLRVIRRSVGVLEVLDSQIPKECNLARISILTAAAKICCLYLGFREKVDLSHLKDTSTLEVAQYLESEKGEDHGLSDGDKLIIASGFTDGPCDDYLIELIKTGSIDWSDFKQKVRDVQNHHEEVVANSMLENELRSLIENYSRNDEDIAGKIKRECELKLLLLRPGTIDWAGEILVDLGEPDFRSEWFDRWASENLKRVSDKGIRHVLEGIESVPKQLKPAYKEEAVRRQPVFHMEKVLLARLTQQPFYQSQIDQIAEFPLEKYVSWIRESKSEHLRGIIRDLFSEFYKRPGSEGVIAEKTLQAVEQLAGESRINSLRAKYFKRALPKKTEAD